MARGCLAVELSVKLSTEPLKDFYFRCAGLNLSPNGTAKVSVAGKGG